MSIQFSAKMRKKAYQGFFIITIISLAGVPTFFKLIFNTGQSVAVVDGMTVSPQEYQAAIMKKENQIAALRSQFSAMGIHLDDAMLSSIGLNTNTRETALEDIINEKLLDKVAQSLHIHIHADYVAQILKNPQLAYQLLGDSLPYQMFSAQGLNVDMLKAFLQRQGKTLESLDALIEAKMERTLVSSLVKESALVSSADVAAYSLRNYAPRTFAVTMANYAHYVKVQEKQQPTAQEIQSFFATHNAATHRYWSPEKRSGTVWSFKASGFGVPAKEFEERFMRDIKGVQSAPAATFAAFAEQKQGSKQAISGKSPSEGRAHKALFGLTQGRRTVYVDQGIGYVVELMNIEKSQPLPLEQAKSQVVSDIYHERAQKHVAEILASQDPEVAKKELLAGNLKVVTVTIKPGKEENKQVEQLRKDGISVEKMERMFLKKQSFTGAADAFGYKVDLIDVGSINQELAQKGKHVMNAALAQENSYYVDKDFIASLREHAKIVMNRSLLKGM